MNAYSVVCSNYSGVSTENNVDAIVDMNIDKDKDIMDKDKGMDMDMELGGAENDVGSSSLDISYLSIFKNSCIEKL